MKKLLCFLLIACGAAFGQTITGTITASGCLQANVYGYGIVGIQVKDSGTPWTGTIQPQVIAEESSAGTAANVQITPYSSSTAAATITANGSYTANVVGATWFQVCGNTVTNTAAIKLTPIRLAANRNAGTGSGTVTSVSGTTGSVAVATGTTTPVVSLDPTVLNSMESYATDTGSANVIAIAVPSWYPATATLGTCVEFKAAASTTGATTINVTPSGGSAYGAIALMKRTTSGVAALGASGDVVIGGMYSACYDGTQWVLSTSSSTTYTGGALTTQGVLTGNGANQIAGTSTMTMTGGLFAKINNETLAGVGVPFVRGQTLQKAETTSADASVLSVTPAATAGTYRACVVISVSSATSGVISWTLSYTDSNGNAQSNVAQFLVQQGTAAPNTTFTTSAAGNYHGCSEIDVNNAAAAIVVKWVGGGTTAAKMTAIIERLGV